MELLIFLLLALPVFLLSLLKKNKTTKKYKLPLGPKGLPIIGNLHQLYFSTPQKRLWEMSKKYGPLIYLKLGAKPTLVVTSAKMAKDVLKTYDLNFCSRPKMLGSQRLSYNAIDVAFSPYNDYWREMRKISVIHLFNSNRNATFRPIREDEASRLVNSISKSAAINQPFNLSQGMLAFANNVILRAATGDKRTHVEERLSNLLDETQFMFAGFFFSDYFPFGGKIIDRLRGLLRRLEKNFSDYDALYQDIIDENLRKMGTKSDYENLVEVLLKLLKEKTYKIQLTFDHIKAMLMNVFVAGTDTSAASVVWAMCLLMKNREAMRKAQEELRSLVGKKGFVDEDDIPKLTYFKALIKETMRLEPSVPMLVARESIEDCKLGGYDIPAKTLVYVDNYAVGRDPEAWDKPLKFRPERFLGSSIDIKGNDYELIPFGAGRRICPGYFMGIANVEIALANILYRFDWEMPAGMKPDDIDLDDKQPGIVVQKKHHLLLLPKAYITA